MHVNIMSLVLKVVLGQADFSVMLLVGKATQESQGYTDWVCERYSLWGVQKFG